MKPTSYLMTYN